MSGDAADPPGISCELDLTDSTAELLVRVRRWAAAELADLGDDHLSDVTLVAVELVTNAYDHGDGPRTVRLTRSQEPCAIEVEVEDSNDDRPTLGISRFGAEANRGRGLVIVDRMSGRWGVRPRPETGGKVVWAEISCDGRPCGS